MGGAATLEMASIGTSSGFQVTAVALRGQNWDPGAARFSSRAPASSADERDTCRRSCLARGGARPRPLLVSRRRADCCRSR